MVSDRRVAATAYTGSGRGGLALKPAADAAGVPIYLEMSSVNPTVILPGAWKERGEVMADDLVASMLLGCGQFCTNSGLVNLTGSIYAAADANDDGAYSAIEPVLRERVGRLLNDKAPTGVAVVPAIHHGGLFPATGHPGLTGVGIPASLIRFGMLQCYDNVFDHRLPPELQAANPLGIQRLIDQEWMRNPVTWGS